MGARHSIASTRGTASPSAGRIDRGRRAMPIPTEIVGSLPRPRKLQYAYEDLRPGQDHVRGPAEAAGRGRQGLDPAPGADRREVRDRRRAARVELRHLPDHGHAGRHRPGGQPGRATASSSPSSTTATTASCPRLTGGPSGTRPSPASSWKEQGRAEQRGQAGRDFTVDDDAAVPLDDEIDGYPREQFLDDVLDEVGEGHPRVLRGRRRARVDRLHRGPAGQQERLAQPLDRQGHAPGLHRPQQPRA